MTNTDKVLSDINAEDTAPMDILCPKCEQSIDHLLYAASTTERGYCSLDGSQWHEKSTEVESSTYYCPACEKAISPLR